MRSSSQRRYTGQIKKTPRFVGRTSRRPDCGPGKSVGMLGKSLPGMAFGPTACCCQPLSSQWLAASSAQRFCKHMWEGSCWEGVWPCLDPWVLWVCQQRLASGMSRGRYGPHSELFIFRIRKEPVAFYEGSAVQACCLCGHVSRHVR